MTQIQGKMIQFETCDTWGTSGCVPLFLWKIIRIKISQSKYHNYQGDVLNSVKYLAQFLAKWPTLQKSKNKNRFPKCAQLLPTCCRDSTPEWWLVGPCLSEQLFLWLALLLLAEQSQYEDNRISGLKLKNGQEDHATSVHTKAALLSPAEVGQSRAKWPNLRRKMMSSSLTRIEFRLTNISSCFYPLTRI